MKIDLVEEMELPEGLTASYEAHKLTVKGKNEVVRTLFQPSITLGVKDNKIIIVSKNASKREKCLLFTMRAHIKNMFKGAAEGHTYKLRICSGHFPMNVSIKDGALVVKNFLGETVPRVLELKQGADVKMEGEEIMVHAPNLELAGQQAGDIEQLTRVSNRDRRIFQDGIYIIEKDGRSLL